MAVITSGWRGLDVGPSLDVLFQRGVNDEFADEIGVNSCICRQVSKICRRNTPPWRKTHFFETQFFSLGYTTPSIATDLPGCSLGDISVHKHKFLAGMSHWQIFNLLANK